MNQDAMLLGGFLCVAGSIVLPGLGILIFFAIRRGRKYAQDLDAWAARRGVRLQSNYPHASFQANLDGVACRLSHPRVIRGMGNARRAGYRYHLAVEIPAYLADFVVRPQGNVFSQLLDVAFREQDITVGDAAFDKDFVVQTQHVDAARALLDPSVCSAIAEARRLLEAQGLREFVLARNALHLTGDDHFPVDKLDATFRILAPLALTIAARANRVMTNPS